MNSPEKGGRRLTKELRYAQLLKCAIHVAAKKGLGQLVHADVAEEAGVVPPTVFRYFPSRRALVRGVVDEVGRYYRKQLDDFHLKPARPREALHEHLLAFSNSIDTHSDYAAVWLQWGASVQNDCGIWDMFGEHNDYLIKVLSRSIRMALPDGRRKDIATSKIRASSLIGAAFAITMLKFSDAPEEAIVRLITIALDDPAA